MQMASTLMVSRYSAMEGRQTLDLACHLFIGSDYGSSTGKKESQVCLPTALLYILYSFTQMVMETQEVFGPWSLTFLKDLGRSITQMTGKEKSFCYLIQCYVVAEQRGNAAPVHMGVTGHMGAGTLLSFDVLNIYIYRYNKLCYRCYYF